MPYKRDKNGTLEVTKDEAVYIRDEYARHREFWIYDMDSNKELLQAALDMLQNSISCNDYSVEYKDSQNSCRLTIYCHPCNIYLASYDPFMSHDSGKAHKKILKLMMDKKSEHADGYLDNFKRLNSIKNIFDTDSLEHDLDHAIGSVMGLQFVYKEQLHGPDSSYRYSCQLCCVDRVSEDNIFRHLVQGIGHNRNYMSVKFNTTSTESTERFQRLCRATEMREGKINHQIVDFTDQFVAKRKLLERSPSPSLSPPPSPNSPTKRKRASSPTSPPPALGIDQGCQVDTDELDQWLELKEELVLLRVNEGDENLIDRNATELLLHTLQALNLKMHGYYGSMGKKQKMCVKYQYYVVQLNHMLDEIWW